MIVLYHTNGTMSSGVSQVLPSLSENFYNANIATADLQHLITGFFHHFGAWGNIIFFVCSFWFLCNSKKPIKVNKILQMMMDVYLISVIYLLVIGQFEVLSIKDIIKSLLPNLFGNNWFITCYLMIVVFDNS